MEGDERTPREAEAAEHCARVLRPVFTGRRFLVIGGPVAGLAKWARELRALGAESCFLLADSLGTGTLPDPAETPWATLGTTGEDMVDAMRNGERALARLPDRVRREVDRWDPEGRALAVGGIVLTDVDTVAGRRRFGRRPPEWIALEDKVAVDAFFDATGIPRPPSEVVAAEGAALRVAARRLDRGLGTAWAGDAREGPNGGAVYLRRVRTEADAEEAADWLAKRCDRVRVTPFLEGIPCSIHGVVFPGGGTAVFRPVEMVTLRPATGNRLLYAGAATFWDPPPADREAMRSAARRAGDALHRRLGYRGAFTVDGVLSEEGFRATELNPRLGAGHNQLAAAIPGLPLTPIALAAVEGCDLDYRPGFLEEVLTEAADRNRAGGCWMVVAGHRETTETRDLVEEDGTYRPAAEGEEPAGTMALGPSPSGAFVRFLPRRGGVPPGPPFAPRAVRAFAAADRWFGTSVGPTEAAREVRTGER